MSKLPFLLLLTLSTNLFAEINCPADKPFKRAIVFPGGSLQMVVYLGMLKAAEEAGKAPDVIVADCGGTLAASIAHTVSDSDGRIELLKSKEMHEMLRSVNPNDESSGKVLKYVITKSKSEKQTTVAPIISSYFLEVPKELGIPEFNANFNEDQIPVVLSAGKILHKEEDEGTPINGRELYQEVIFTDKTTASKIKSLPRPFQHYHHSDKVVDKIEINSSFRINDAVRASISEPIMMNPITVKGQIYNVRPQTLEPLMIAKQIACETIMPFRYGLSPIESGMIENVFGVSYNERLIRTHSEYSDYWVDLTDQAIVDKKSALGPVLKLTKGRMMLTIPEDYEEYRERMQALYDYGYERGMEALKGNIRNEKTHIRMPKENNSTKELMTKIEGDKKVASNVSELISKAKNKLSKEEARADKPKSALKSLVDAQIDLVESAHHLASLYSSIKIAGENSSYDMQANTKNYLELLKAWAQKNSRVQEQIASLFTKNPELRKHEGCGPFDGLCDLNKKIDELRNSSDEKVSIWKSLNAWSKNLKASTKLKLTELKSIMELKK